MWPLLSKRKSHAEPCKVRVPIGRRGLFGSSILSAEARAACPFSVESSCACAVSERRWSEGLVLHFGGFVAE
jgi:hypothetical protein